MKWFEKAAGGEDFDSSVSSCWNSSMGFGIHGKKRKDLLYLITK